jgi:hypothetical protein
LKIAMKGRASTKRARARLRRDTVAAILSVSSTGTRGAPSTPATLRSVL